MSSCLNIGAEVRCSELKCPCYRPLFVENRARSSSWMSNTSWTCHQLAARVRLLDTGQINNNDENDARSVALAALRARVVPELVAEDQPSCC